MFKIVSTQEELLRAFCVRNIVFVHGQSCPYEIEYDGLDYGAVHVLGEESGQPFAAGRIRFLAPYAKLERIAVRAEYRGRGLGHALIDYMIAAARERGFTQLKMHAQAYLVDYYRRHGFEPRGDMFQEAGIDHYLMVRHDQAGQDEATG